MPRPLNADASDSASAGRRPQYESAAQALAEIIALTEPGEHLPSEPRLSRKLGVSRATLREAMRSFEERGWIVRRQGVGTVVTGAGRIIESGLEVLESLETMAARMGMRVNMGRHAIREREAQDQEVQALGLPPSGRVNEITRVMLTEGQPVAYLIDVIPVELLSRELLGRCFAGSVLDLLLELRQPVLSHARTEITAVAASQHIARPLNIARGEVLLCLRGNIFDGSGRMISRSESYFLPWAFRFHVVRRFSGVRNSVEKNRIAVDSQSH